MQDYASKSSIWVPKSNSFEDNFYRRLLPVDALTYISPSLQKEEELKLKAETFLKTINANYFLSRTIQDHKNRIHLLVIEKLPPFIKRDKQMKGHHLGIFHYVYDDKYNNWYLLARYGRGHARINERPYSTKEGALQRMDKLANNIGKGRFANTQYLVHGKSYEKAAHKAWQLYPEYSQEKCIEEKKEEENRIQINQKNKLKKLGQRGVQALLHNK